MSIKLPDSIGGNENPNRISSSPASVNGSAGGVYIETYGCQMNMLDSELVATLLQERGYTLVDRPELAELILVNTCAVREHAEVKAISNIGRFKKLKRERGELRVGVLGCLSRHAGESLAEQLPFLDWIIGPDAYRRLPALLLEPPPEVPLILTEGAAEELYDEIYPARRQKPNAWVTISRGCNNHCTYCVVPAARGEERHRPAESILEEVRRAKAEGYTQVTLLGQNVNSYQGGSTTFPKLLARVARETGIERVRFLTSHPKDCSQELLEVMAGVEGICPELHLPVQAGSDRVLKRMGRHYTAEHYLELVEAARSLLPDLLLSTDIIVGFPGETDQDYQATLDVVGSAGYDDAFVYKYSQRPNTPAAERFEDDVPEKVKVERLMGVNDLVRASGLAKRRGQIGRCLPVMIEGTSSRSEEEMLGRTAPGHNVIVPGNWAPGKVVPVEITELSGYTLRGVALAGETVEEHR